MKERNVGQYHCISTNPHSSVTLIVKKKKKKKKYEPAFGKTILENT